MTTTDKLTLPSQDKLNAVLEYRSDTGKLYWKHRPDSFFKSAKAAEAWNRRHSGKEAMTSVAHNGYLYGTVLGVGYKAHRVIWVMIHGEQPEEVDHINGIRSDNRIENLRNVSRSQNSMNMKIRCDNSSGHIGVYYLKHRGTWLAGIKKEGVLTHLGTFYSKEDAIRARQAAEANQGFHENHGRIGHEQY